MAVQKWYLNGTDIYKDEHFEPNLLILKFYLLMTLFTDDESDESSTQVSRPTIKETYGNYGKFASFIVFAL